MGRSLNKEAELGSPGNRNPSPGRDETVLMRLGAGKPSQQKLLLKACFASAGDPAQGLVHAGQVSLTKIPLVHLV